MTALNTIFIVILIVIAWVLLDLYFGRKQHIRKLKMHTFPKRQSELNIFAHGKMLFNDYFEEVHKAKDHVHVLFYIIKDDEISDQFLQLLKEKAKQGVEVRLLLDWVGSFRVRKKMVQSLKQSGVQFSFCHKPSFPFIFYTLQARNHRKISIIDGKIGYVGGFNVGKEYIDQDPKLSPWRDFHLKMKGEGVHDLQTQFLEDWRHATRTNLLNNQIYYPTLFKGNIQHQMVPNEGVTLEAQFLQLLRKAKKSIVIGTPYFIPSKKIFKELQQIAKQGISITILSPKKSDHILVKEASYRYFRKLLANGATVYNFLNGFYHAKVIIIDDQVCDIGTANFDKRSLFLNHEINCFIHDTAFIHEVEKLYLQDVQDSEIVTMEMLHSKGLLSRIREGIAYIFSYFL